MTLKVIPPASWDLLLHPENDREYVHFEQSEQFRFEHDARDFSRINAWWLADAALLAYRDESSAQPIWDRAGLDFKYLSVGGTQCHVAWAEAFAIVAFRGTQPNFADVFDIVRGEHDPGPFGGSVHGGFLAAHQRIWPLVQDTLEEIDSAGRTIWFTGHSLGGALATLSMDRFNGARGLYTIGSPTVGDRTFATSFDSRHQGRCFRFVNHLDFVVHAPEVLSFLGLYSHVKELKFIDAQGGISSDSPSALNQLSLIDAGSHARNLLDAHGQGLDVPPPPHFLADHIPRSYAVHIWNDLDSQVAMPV